MQRLRHVAHGDQLEKLGRIGRLATAPFPLFDCSSPGSSDFCATGMVSAWCFEDNELGAATTGVFGFLYFAMLGTVIPTVVFIAIVLSISQNAIQYGPQAALIAESFTPRLRYSGASLGYQLASVIAGGPAPLVATAILAVVGLVSAAFMPDHTGKDVSMEYDGRA
jgi:hypothetical protein